VIAVTVEGWAAWAPGLEEAEAWRVFAGSENPVAMLAAARTDVSSRPELTGVPAMKRRRMGRIARMMTEVALLVCPQEQRGRAAIVFASRHGEVRKTKQLLETLAGGELPSPLGFSHSVHNAPPALLSMLFGNHEGLVAVAAGPRTFGHGFVEAAVALEANPDRPVLLLAVDEPPPEAFLHQVRGEAPCSRAVGLLLRPVEFEGASVGRVSFELVAEPDPEPGCETPLPPDLGFLRFLLRRDSAFDAPGFRWRRDSSGGCEQ
jgi:hypothetical protein